MKPADAEALVKLYAADWAANRDRMDLVDRWYRGRLAESDKPKIPPGRATREYRELRDRAVGKFLKLAVASLAQSLYVVGYRRTGEADNTPAWAAWQANRMDARQIAVHRGALSLGLAYVAVLPGSPVPVWRSFSARSMVAFWQDPEVDEWPMHALAGKPINGRDGSSHWRFQLFDDDAVYTVDSDAERTKFTYISHERHRVGVCPVVRYANELDLDGRSEGEVEPNIDLAARLDQDTFDRLVVQRFGSWVVRTISGMLMPESADASTMQAEKLRLSVEDILVAESPDTKFDTLQGTQLDGYLRAKESDIYEFGAVMQVPPTDLIGQIVNISAEALAAAQAGKNRKIDERKQTFGESHEQAFRLTAHLMGDEEGSQDWSAEVAWDDKESRSLSQAADALGKLATMLGVPARALWERIPGVTQQDVERWKQMAEDDAPMAQLLAELAAGQLPAGG